MKLFFCLFFLICAFLGLEYLLKYSDILFQIVGIGMVALIGTWAFYEARDFFQGK